jgi:uncharacterized protein
MHDAGGVTLSPTAGIGLRAPHVAEVIASRPAVGWLEVHAENYMGGGPAIRALEMLRRDYPISLHGVGLSLGSADGVSVRHLRRLKALVERIQPAAVSEHLSWSVAGGTYLNHLLPLPYTEDALDVVSRHVEHVQRALGRAILVENPSSYLRFRDSRIPEVQFLGELAERTGCGILLDVNNVYVSARNFDQDPAAYLDAVPAAAVGEIHLAGHAVNDADGHTILIDDHGSPIAAPVWRLYERTLRRIGAVPTLIEWDTDIPELSVLVAQAEIAKRCLDGVPRADGDERAA